jgi:LysM repeat protein
VSPSPSISAGPSAQPSFRATYKVKKGDTLLGIATQFGTTTAAIRDLNGLASSSLKIGQVLKIP